MKLKKFIAPLLVGVLAFAIAGCGTNTNQSSQAPKEIKIGATSGPHAQVAEAVAKEAKKQGIDLKVVEFSDYVTPDKALADGDIQLNAYQHVPFMENFNKQNGSNLVAIGKTLLVRMGLYSNSVHSVQDVPEGATVSIPNDPTNGGRALVLLAKAGLITLKDGVGFKATVADITSNPKNIKIQELEAAQLPRSLDDVTIAVIPMNYVQSAGLSVEKQGFFFESKDEPLTVIVLAVRSEDKDNETYKKIADIYKSDAIKQFINDTFKGSITSAN
ncbi:MAG: MetQ/NlpA family ABC transporter substrate-binding protein [Veillonella nakazawae]